MTIRTPEIENAAAVLNSRLGIPIDTARDVASEMIHVVDTMRGFVRQGRDINTGLPLSAFDR